MKGWLKESERECQWRKDGIKEQEGFLGDEKDDMVETGVERDH